MTSRKKMEYLRDALADQGCKCDFNASEPDGRAVFVLEKGEVTLEFQAQAKPNKNPLRARCSTVFIETGSQRMSFPFGYKKPDGEKYRFYMTGLNRSGGDDPKEFSDRRAAKEIAAEICQKLKL